MKTQSIKNNYQIKQPIFQGDMVKDFAWNAGGVGTLDIHFDEKQYGDSFEIAHSLSKELKLDSYFEEGGPQLVFAKNGDIIFNPKVSKISFIDSDKYDGVTLKIDTGKVSKKWKMSLKEGELKSTAKVFKEILEKFLVTKAEPKDIIAIGHIIKKIS